jgi:hypothetical protein
MIYKFTVEVEYTPSDDASDGPEEKFVLTQVSIALTNALEDTSIWKEFRLAKPRIVRVTHPLGWTSRVTPREVGVVRRRRR